MKNGLPELGGVTTDYQFLFEKASYVEYLYF